MNTNNGCTFTNFQFKAFCSQWETDNHMGIPYNPPCKGIIKQNKIKIKKPNSKGSTQKQKLT